MRGGLRWFGVVLLSLGLFVGAGPHALAQIEGSNASNVEEGDNEANADQGGDSISGDANGGQVTGITSGGDASVDGRNRTVGANVKSGDVAGTNESGSFTGEAQAAENEIQVGAEDIENISGEDLNVQEGDNAFDLEQMVSAVSGDAVAGQVIGVVTSAGGSADVVADNASEDIDVETGEATASNTSNAFTGLALAEDSVEVGAEDIEGIDADDNANIQEGDNNASVAQSSVAASGDGVGGQVIGVVSAGDTSIDARNRSEDADIETGQAEAEIESASFTGLGLSGDNDVSVGTTDIEDIDVDADLNLQEGDNDKSVSQDAAATSGDGVAGQVIGAVTSAGASADIVADNASEDVDAETGATEAENDSNAFVGLASGNDEVEIGTSDIEDVDGPDRSNIQEGDNAQDIAQTASATSGDAVGGQVLGVVSAGDASLDARNRSEGADVESGAAEAENEAASFAGHAVTEGGDLTVAPEDIEDVTDIDDLNLQEGDNSQSLDQAADAASGDAVGGQVAGIVTSAGGSADVVADNASEDVDVTTGEANATNSSSAFTGLAFSQEDIDVGLSDISDIDVQSPNIQEGDNDQSISQTATASSGDGVGGQVLGVVSAGDASLDARNRSEDSDVATGPAEAANEVAAYTGLAIAEFDDIEIGADLDNIDISEDRSNLQEGDNDTSIAQAADASSGDGVAGQVAGIVTSAGGSADVVADNASEDVDAKTGEALATNEADAFTGLGKADDDFEVGAADIDDVNADDTSIQEGDNAQDIAQTATASSGDSVGGQVLGVVSAGDASLDARNRSEDIDVESGVAEATNDAAAVAGLVFADDDIEIDASDIENINIDGDANIQEGDNTQSIDQAADASTGDAVGGQVAGIVTSAGGVADVVADNASEDVDVETGAATAENTADALVGLALADDGDIEVGISDIEFVTSSDELNVQEGDNEQTFSQAATASTGDGVGGQVLGVVSAGDASLDARNRSEDVDLSTGAAEATNEDSSAFAGLALNDGDDITIVDISTVTADDELNLQEGDNTQEISQSADASSGDAVGGQVAGIVTSAGGAADVVADNASEDADVETGAATADNETDAFTGLANANEDVEVGTSDIENVTNDEGNVQEGDNDQSIDQLATASSGDGVAGQVLGVVSAGDTSLDARNRSEDVDLETGVADAANEADVFVGHAMAEDDIIVSADISNIDLSERANVQEGDNSQSIDQAADASSGDGVGGQVIGVVTAAGGSADVVADNASEDVEVDTGAADASNEAGAFAGLANAEEDVVVEDISGVTTTGGNVQEGDNIQAIEQAADASSGDGVGGQVLGVVSAGDTSLDARNRSEDVDAETGDADAANDARSFTGLAVAEGGVTVTADLENVTIDFGNAQDGDNERLIAQTADASSGDAVGGQVAGVVTSAGGSVDAVVDNVTENFDGETGNAAQNNETVDFTGHSTAGGDLTVASLADLFVAALG